MALFQGHRNVTHYSGQEPDSWFAYTCGHCGNKVSGAVVSAYTQRGDQKLVQWLLCPACADGSVRAATGVVYPGVMPGFEVQGLPVEVGEGYTEARRCMSVAAHTACELICRKILMHVAVEKGAAEGAAFETYLAHLETKGYVTPPMKPWVALIRKHGNLATHRLAAPDAQRAESTLMFTAELLRLVYEMEHMAQRYAPPTSPVPSTGS